MKTLYVRSAWLTFALLINLLVLVLGGSASHTHATVAATPWTVFMPADGGLPMASIELTSADFEASSSGNEVRRAYIQELIVDTDVDENDGSCADDCSLRDAIQTATDGAIITFAGDYTIYLSSTLEITKNLTIDGFGQTVTVSGDTGNDGDSDVRVFLIQSSGVVTISHLNVISGTATTMFGGGISNEGTMTVNNSVFSDNASHNGGGIYNEGTMTINNSIFSGNSTKPTSSYAQAGGGIWNQDTMTVNNSTFFGNSTFDFGGAIYNSGTLTVSNSTFFDNSVVWGSGGAIFNYSSMLVSNSTFSGNSADISGGGIYNFNNGTMHLQNSVIANSTSGGDCRNYGTIATSTNNLVEDSGSDACGLTNGSNGNIIGSDPILSDLGDYGGDTQTFALLPSSPAIDAGDNATCSRAQVNNLDQRGESRLVGFACDIGAFESQGFNLSISGGDQQRTLINTPFSNPLEVTFAANVITEPIASGIIITFASPDSGAGLTTPTFSAATNADGVVSATVTANSIRGNYTVTATADSVSDGVVFELTNTTLFSLTVDLVGNGSVEPNPVGTPLLPNCWLYEEGTQIQLEATPALGWRFEGWSGDLIGAVSPATITMTQDMTVTANFEPSGFDIYLPLVLKD